MIVVCGSVIHLTKFVVFLFGRCVKSTTQGCQCGDIDGMSVLEIV